MDIPPNHLDFSLLLPLIPNLEELHICCQVPHTILCTVQYLYFTLHSTTYPLYSVQYNICTILCTEHHIHYVYMHYTLHSTIYALYSAQYNICTMYTLHSTTNALYFAQNTIYTMYICIILCTVQYMHNTLHRTPYTLCIHALYSAQYNICTMYLHLAP